MKSSIYFMAAALLGLLLFGCSENPTVLEASKPSQLMASFGTLSDSSNPVEMVSAGTYTKLAMFRFDAAQKLRSGEISVANAKERQSFADRIRAKLDHSVKAQDVGQILDIRDELNEGVMQYETH